MRSDVLREVVDAQRAGRDVVLATRLSDGAQELIARGVRSSLLGLDSDSVAAALGTGDPRTVDTVDGAVFLRPYVRSPRLIIVGAVHIAQALVPMATIAGFQVTVLDPREGFATADRFPGAALVREWPDQVMDGLRPDNRTGIVALTHDPKIDDPALEVAVRAPVFYIGALGSRRTHGKRLERLREKGFSEDELGRIHAPIGLAIGARSPAEIAVSIMAEVTQVRRQPPEGKSK